MNYPPDSQSTCSIVENPPGDAFNLHNCAAYERWKDRKIADFQKFSSRFPLPLDDLTAPPAGQLSAIIKACASANMAIYELAAGAAGHSELKPALKAFSNALGLARMEDHRSADDGGIVAIEVTDRPKARGYIPYTPRRLSWHTDGYYNDPATPVRAFLLHCVRAAPSGGANQLLDPDFAYIALRDENPACIEALMHPQAMTIPANDEGGGKIRPARTGPVFMVDPHTGALHMRYTTRTRSIIWRDDKDTRMAVDFLSQLLDASNPYVLTLALQPGQGIICNNVLHNRASFENPGDSTARLLYRIRYFDPVSTPTTRKA